MTSRADRCIRTEDDVEQLWLELMDPLGFSRRAVNLMLITGTSVLPGLITVDDLPIDDVPGDAERIDEANTDGFAETLRMLARELGIDRISALVSRPGAGDPTPADLAWVRVVQAAAAHAGLVSGLAYLATDTHLRPVRVDDMG